MQMLRGQIWLVKLETTNNSIQGGSANGSGIRPCVIISNNACNNFSTVLHVVPVTSRKKSQLPTHIEIYKNTSGLLVDSTALCEQSMLIPKENFIKCVGLCNSETVKRINYGLMVQFDLVQERIKEII